MRSLRLKFPYTGQQSPVIDYFLLIIGLLVLIFVLQQFKSVVQRVDYWEARVERLTKQQQQLGKPVRRQSRRRIREAGVEAREEIRDEIRQASEILVQINLPWEAFFNAIEFASGKEVALLSLQPNVANRILRISGEAKNMSGLLDFVKALEREDVFENAHLLNYKVKLDSAQRPIIFLITARWIK